MNVDESNEYRIMVWKDAWSYEDDFRLSDSNDQERAEYLLGVLRDKRPELEFRLETRTRVVVTGEWKVLNR